MSERVRLDDFNAIPTGTFGEAEARRRQETPARRTSWTAADLLAAELPEPRSAVEGLLPEGLAFMAGSPKLGKSWLGLGVALAVASGGFVLGTIEVAPEGLFIETEWPRLDDGGLERLAAWLDEHPRGRACS